MSEVWGSLTRLMASDFPVLYADFLRGCDPVIHEQAGIFVPYEPRELADCPECDEMCPIEILQDRDGKDEYLSYSQKEFRILFCDARLSSRL